MIFKNNFISVIALGNFNPGILTPDFLQNDCKMRFASEATAQVTPVLSNVTYENISFTAELERLQIVEKDIKDFSESHVVEYMDKYLKVLKYTPLTVCGVNFNVSISGVNDRKIRQSFADKNVATLKKLLKSDELIISVKVKHTLQNKTEHLGWNIGFGIQPPNIIGQLNVKKKADAFLYNLNYEVRNLTKDKGQVATFVKSYLEVAAFHKEVLSKLFGI